MKDIELIEKYRKQRQKHRRWDVYAKDTDLQRLARLETGCWTLLLYFGFNLHSIVRHTFGDRMFPKLANVGILVFMGYLLFELYRTHRLRGLFERTAVQNATDLIDIMKNTAPNQSSDLQDAVARGSKGEHSG